MTAWHRALRIGELIHTLYGAHGWEHTSWEHNLHCSTRHIHHGPLSWGIKGVGIGDGDIGDAERAVLSDVLDGTVTP